MGKMCLKKLKKRNSVSYFRLILRCGQGLLLLGLYIKFVRDIVECLNVHLGAIKSIFILRKVRKYWQD